MVQINVVKDCVNAVLVHATFEHVYLDNRVCFVAKVRVTTVVASLYRVTHQVGNWVGLTYILAISLSARFYWG